MKETRQAGKPATIGRALSLLLALVLAATMPLTAFATVTLGDVSVSGGSNLAMKYPTPGKDVTDEVYVIGNLSSSEITFTLSENVGDTEVTVEDMDGEENQSAEVTAATDGNTVTVSGLNERDVVDMGEVRVRVMTTAKVTTTVSGKMASEAVTVAYSDALNSGNNNPSALTDNGTVSEYLDYQDVLNPSNSSYNGDKVTITAVPGDDRKVTVTVGGVPVSLVADTYSFNLTASKEYTVNIVFADDTPTPAPTYTVTYDANGGTGGPTDSTQYSDGAKAMVKLTPEPTRDGYTFLGWSEDPDATDPEYFYATGGGDCYIDVTGNVTLYAVWYKNSTTVDPDPNDKKPTSTSSGKSSSGSGGGGGSTTTTADLSKTTSPNVSANGAVSQNSAVSELNKAIASADGSTATVKVQNAQVITASTLSALASSAEKSGKEAVVMADTLSSTGAIQARLYVEPAKLAGLKADIKLRIVTEGARPAQTKNFFEKYFNNKVAVVSCEQQGSFGAKLKIAAKVNLPGDTGALRFYSYDKATNSYRQIQTAYTIDKNGYIHFSTELAGDIVISNGPLVKK